MASDTGILTLNVGGKIFQTNLETINKYPDSVLVKMFSADSTIPPCKKDKDGNWFIDRNPYMFSHILDFYRSDFYPEDMSEILKHEFKYWGVYKKKEYTEEQKFAKEFAKYVLLNHQTNIRSCIYGGLQESERKSYWTFYVPLNISTFFDSLGYDNANAFKGLIEDTLKWPHNKVLYHHPIKAIIFSSFNLNLKQYSEKEEKNRQLLIKKELTKEEIKVVRTNIQKITDYLCQFNSVTANMICRYLSKELGVDFKIKWETIICDEDEGASPELSTLVLPIWEQLFTTPPSTSFSSKLLVFTVKGDKYNGYGNDTESPVKYSKLGSKSELVKRLDKKKPKKQKIY